MKWFKRIFRIAFRIFLGLWLFSILWVLMYRWIDPPITYLMIQQSIVYWKEKGEWKSREHQNVSIHQIHSNMARAVVAAEDQKFFNHSGFDWEAIREARKKNAKSKKLRGASTISQQTAKNVFLWPARSWIRKGLEVYFTILIELFWPKQRILEVYLNVIETGVLTFGVEAASQKYFKKPAARLNAEQASLIAAALPLPRKRNPAKPDRYLQKRAQWIQRQMHQMGDWIQ